MCRIPAKAARAAVHAPHLWFYFLGRKFFSGALAVYDSNHVVVVGTFGQDLAPALLCVIGNCAISIKFDRAESKLERTLVAVMVMVVVGESRCSRYTPPVFSRLHAISQLPDLPPSRAHSIIWCTPGFGCTASNDVCVAANPTRDSDCLTR